jgi:3-dehydrotetronate 4-kinase
MLLGVIADDMTGATDIGSMLAKRGMKTLQVVGVPKNESYLKNADAVIVALKSRTSSIESAVQESLASCDALIAAGAEQIVFKYCSTFDSTATGNIGPVADALLERLGAKRAVVCPALPENGRTVYQGHLFVGSVPLNESSMKDHPLTPMRDSSVVRLMQRQSRHKVALLPLQVLREGIVSIKDALGKAEAAGYRYVVVDSICDNDLETLGAALANERFITGGSGIVLGLPANYRSAGLLAKIESEVPFVAPAGRGAILAGSCSSNTLRQIETARAAGVPALSLDPLVLAQDGIDVEMMLNWAINQRSDVPILFYSTALPAEVARAQELIGKALASVVVERALTQIASALVANGFNRLIVAGGETSGAVVQGLGVSALAIGPEIDPGVPWTRVIAGPDIVLALKSGNFGGPEFFYKAMRLLDGR